MAELYTLDRIDKSILYELSMDARQSYKQIAQKIQSKKDTVAYHITQLTKNGIITKYTPVFSLSKLGIYSSKIYIKLQGLSKEKEKMLYDSLVQNINICWVAKTVGQWDLMIGMYTKNAIDFSIKKNLMLSKFSEFIADYEVTQIEDAFVFYRDYLLETSVNYRGEFVFGGGAEITKLADDEKNIIQLIKNDGRFIYHVIANRLNLDIRTVQAKISYLKKQGILQGFTVFIDTKKLGFQLHKLCISLKDHKEENVGKLISYLKLNPSTIHLIKCLGSWELEIEIESGDINQVYEYSAELKNIFPAMIKRIDLTTITEELKLDFFPEKI
jgi:DNA-binding Lrp family transcriptional regulator